MWILFALLSPAVYTINNFLDKYILSRRVKDYNALPIYTAIVSFSFGLIWWLLARMPLLPFKDAAIIIGTGIITIFSLVVYFKALSNQETSIVILLFQLSPVFTFLLSSIFLKEVITMRQYVAFIIILGATVLLVLPKNKQSWKVPEGFWNIVLFDCMYALIGILLKYSTHDSSFSQIIAYESFGIGIGGVLIYVFMPIIRNAFNKSIKPLFRKALPIIVFNEIIFITAKSLGYFAFVIGPVTLVSVLSNVQVFFGLIFGWVLTTAFPKSFHEDISKKNISIKLISAILLFVGLYLMI